MSARQRIRAAIAGEPVDRPPVSLWRHFPEEDQTAEGLARATLAWQARFGVDLVKFMPPGDYATIDWGAESVYAGSRAGTRRTTRFPVARPEDWLTLRPTDARAGFNGVMLDALAQTRRALDPEVPLLQTVFSPLTVAMKLSDGRVVEHLRNHPAEVHAGLATIAEMCRRVVEATFAVGADGVFFATQCADYGVMDETEYRVFGLKYDLDALAALPEDGILLLHLHGGAPMFHLQARYPANLVNWHDRHAQPTLAEGREWSGRAVAGGIDERAIAHQTAEEVADQVRDAIGQTRGRGLMIAPGCVVPIDTPERNIEAAVRAARRSGEAG